MVVRRQARTRIFPPKRQADMRRDYVMRIFVMCSLSLMLFGKYQGVGEYAAHYSNPSLINNVKTCTILNLFRIA